MAKFSERGRYVIQPSTRSTLGEYDSRPPLARYVWYVTWYFTLLAAHVRPRSFRSFYSLPTLDVTRVRNCTRPSPLYCTASNEKLGLGLGTRLISSRLRYTLIAALCLTSKSKATSKHFNNSRINAGKYLNRKYLPAVILELLKVLGFSRCYGCHHCFTIRSWGQETILRYTPHIISGYTPYVTYAMWMGNHKPIQLTQVPSPLHSLCGK